MLQKLSDDGKVPTFNKGAWTPAIIDTVGGESTQTITWTGWKIEDVPIPLQDVKDAVDFFDSKGDTDKHITIRDSGLQYNLYGVSYTGDTINCTAAAVFDDTLSGWWDGSIGPSCGRASGSANFGGLITIEELEAGEINHALACALPKAQILNEVLFPANVSDGSGTSSGLAVPMGTRLQLDPSLTETDLANLGLTSYDIIIAKAMQRYGIYVTDSSSNFAIYMKSDFDAGDYSNVTGAWHSSILGYLSATRSTEEADLAVLESRLTRTDVIAV